MSISINPENLSKALEAISSLVDKKIENLISEFQITDSNNGKFSLDESTFKEYLNSTNADLDEHFVSKRTNTKKPSSGKPKRPQSGYFLWLNENRGNIKDEYFGNYELKTIKAKDGSTRKEKMVALVTKKAGKLWKEVSDDIKQPFLDRAEELKQEYKVALDNWKSSGESNVEAKPKKKRGRPKKNVEVEEDDSAEVVKVKKIDYNGIDYLLDESNNDVYNMNQDLVGKFECNDIIFS
jgi:hypothetical protein